VAFDSSKNLIKIIGDIKNVEDNKNAEEKISIEAT